MEFITTYNSEQKIWSGTKTQSRLFDAQCSVGRIALFMMRSKPEDTICQISDSEGTTLTFGTAARYAIRVAQYFKHQLNLTSADVVGIVAGNTTLLMPVAVGCWLNCTPFHTVNPEHEESVIKHLFNITKPKLLFCDGAFYKKLQRATCKLNAKIYTLCNHVDGVAKVEDLLAPTQSDPEPLQHGADQTMVIMCSSGTTGLPKATCMSNARILTETNLTDGSSVIFSFSTPDWGSCIVSIISNTIVGGIRVITMKPFTSTYMLGIIKKYKVSMFGGSPHQMSQIAHSPQYTKELMQGVKVIFMTGGYCSANTMESIRSKLSMGAVLINSYGSSEFGGIAINYKNYKVEALEILPNVQVKIIETKQQKRNCHHNEIGEVYAYNEHKWMGYYGNAKATHELLDADGWIATGDLGYMDEEQYLHLVGRNKDIMKYMGMQYSPYEIEETISELPDVVDVCVFGVYNERVGDLAAAAVVKKDGSKLSEMDVVKFVTQKQEVKHKHLNYDVPIFFVKKIARNANGKLLRNKVREFCLEKLKI